MHGHHHRLIWTHSSGEVETQLHKIPGQVTWLKRMAPSVGPLIGLALRTPNTGVCPAYNNHNHTPGALCLPKSLKCMFAATNPQANDLLKTGILKKTWGMTDLKNVNPKS